MSIECPPELFSELPGLSYQALLPPGEAGTRTIGENYRLAARMVVAAALVRLGFSQEDVAADFGVDRRTIGSYVKEERDALERVWLLRAKLHKGFRARSCERCRFVHRVTSGRLQCRYGPEAMRDTGWMRVEEIDYCHKFESP